MLDTSLLLDMMAEELRFSLNIPPGTRDFSRLDRAMIAISSERIVCHCLRVTEGQIKSAIDTQSGGKAALSDYVRHETPASAPVLSAQQSQPVEKSVHSVENHDDEVVTLPMPEEDARPVVTGPIIGPAAPPTNGGPAASTAKAPSSSASSSRRWPIRWMFPPASMPSCLK